MSERDGQAAAPQKTLRWFCGVPVLTNPLILIDLLTGTAALWFVTVLIMALAQLMFGTGSLQGSHIAAASIYASYLTALVLFLFAAVCAVFYRRGYVMFYRFEQNGVFMETIRARKVPGAEGVHVRPFAVEEPAEIVRSVTKNVSWDDVKGVRELRGMNSFQLRGKRGRLAQIYCPDDETYRKALDFAGEKVGHHA
ncbi:hypothetical protein [Pyramidobacter sp. C12-8]|uniref:hypothetical protein n=1 Tax=Pyramidobacter sp. C12-8 TaxID=1943580 RepID=UPI00098F93AC|nr:hypothetical protein [Pyramidobacter sp. C12-8]OON89169.1 hypothetical protein B0D78_05065 [Pyramidobacter sp. C12-8]